MKNKKTKEQLSNVLSDLEKELVQHVTKFKKGLVEKKQKRTMQPHPHVDYHSAGYVEQEAGDTLHIKEEVIQDDIIVEGRTAPDSPEVGLRNFMEYLITTRYKHILTFQKDSRADKKDHPYSKFHLENAEDYSDIQSIPQIFSELSLEYVKTLTGNMSLSGKFVTHVFATQKRVTIKDSEFLKQNRIKETAYVIPARTYWYMMITNTHGDIVVSEKAFDPKDLKINNGKNYTYKTLIEQVTKSIISHPPYNSYDNEVKAILLSILELFDHEEGFIHSKTIFDILESNTFKEKLSIYSLTYQNDQIKKVFSGLIKYIGKNFGEVIGALYVLNPPSEIQGQNQWNRDKFYYVNYPTSNNPIIDFNVLSKEKEEDFEVKDTFNAPMTRYSVKFKDGAAFSIKNVYDNIINYVPENSDEKTVQNVLAVLASNEHNDSVAKRILDCSIALEESAIGDVNIGAVYRNIKEYIHLPPTRWLTLDNIVTYIDQLKTMNKDIADQKTILNQHIFSHLGTSPKTETLLIALTSKDASIKYGIVISSVANYLVKMFKKPNSIWLSTIQKMVSTSMDAKQTNINVSPDGNITVAINHFNNLYFVYHYGGSILKVNNNLIGLKPLALV